VHIFTGTADEALKEWLRVKDDLLAGRAPRQKGDGLTLTALCNHFLTHKLSMLESGELAQRTFNQYYEVCELVIATLGRDRLADDIQQDDFAKLRGVMAKRWGPIRLGNQIQFTRSVFKYGWEAGLLPTPPRYGVSFKKPSAKTLRKVRTAAGPKLFTREQIDALLKHSPAIFKAMVLLAINGALGNTELGLLTPAAIDLNGGWLNYPRAKTAMPRRIPLWPETVEAIRAVIRDRRQPKNPEDAALLFIGPRGQNYVGNSKGYRVTAEYMRVAKLAGVEGRTFYDLRRTFQTVGEGAHDLVAVQSIMGHAPASGDMSAIYRQRIDDDRLKAVVDHVHSWLFPAQAQASPSKKGPRA
jgi:integrase